MRTFTIALLVVVLLGIGFYAGIQIASVDATQGETVDDRVSNLEVRVTLLEATVEAMASGDAEESDSSDTHKVTGEYIERPEAVDGQTCTNFYDSGTTVFLADFDGEVLGTGKLGAGSLLNNGLCSQPFEIKDVPERPGYVVSFERRAVGSSYEFTLEDVQGNDWHIEVVSRYRD